MHENLSYSVAKGPADDTDPDTNTNVLVALSTPNEIINVSQNHCQDSLDKTWDVLAGQLSPRSVQIYRHDLNYFSGWLSETNISSLSALTKQDLVNYRVHLAHKYAKATAGRMLTIARKALAEAVERGELESNPAQNVRGFSSRGSENETPHTALTLDQLRQLLRAIDRSTAIGKRDFALIMLLARTGLRRSEAAALTNADLTQEQGHTIIRVRHGKGDKRRIAKVPVDVVRAIDEYLEATRRTQAGPNEPLFVSFRRGDKPGSLPVTPLAIWEMVKAHAKAIGIESLTPHGLRATFVTLALEGGAKLQQVQYAAGHSDPRTTERYQRRKLNLDNNATDFIHLEL